MSVSEWGTLLGGIGLFLLGMRMMTEGLKLAAGTALKRILSDWTNTPVRGVFSGILITAVVQSSSAVTVAIIGFVNAGLLTLYQAVGVIYGSNVGTTMTGWLVSLVGFNVNVKIFALPFVGIGMFMKLIFGGKRTGSLGEALVGFGLFFLAIDFLKAAFAGINAHMTPDVFLLDGFQGILLTMGVGFSLTLFMQSSSAALALIITAAGQDVLPLNAAASMVIGANLGTTSTAALAVIGATPNAKRVAGAHIAFNFITGLVALIILPIMLWSVSELLTWLEMTPDVPTTLASFHTCFNVLGMVLLWPFTKRFVGFLGNRFRQADEDLARPQHLDTNVAASAPDLACQALGLELLRVFHMIREMVYGIFTHWTNKIPFARYLEIMELLLEEIDRFTGLVRKSTLTPELSSRLPSSTFASRFLTEVCELSKRLVTLEKKSDLPADLLEQIKDFDEKALNLVSQIENELSQIKDSDYSIILDEATDQLKNLKKEIKSTVLQISSQGGVPVKDLVSLLETLNIKLEIILKLEKAVVYIVSLNLDAPKQDYQKVEETK